MKVNIIKDSINAITSDRLTTFVVTFPRFINAEVLRHRMLSFNSASSRAIPSKKLIEDIQNNPAMPVFWGKTQSGMQAYEELDDIKRSDFIFGLIDPTAKLFDTFYKNQIGYPNLIYSLTDKDRAKAHWMQARDCAIDFANRLQNLGLHKQIANRILEPWQNITLIISGTEWENFFKLRASEYAQPEFRVLAEMMLEEYNKNIPEIKLAISEEDLIGMELLTANDINLIVKNITDWHIPYEEKMPDGLTKYEELKVSIARCARVSYLTQDGEINKDKDFELYDRLTTSGHFSPCEHVAFPIDRSSSYGNFRGWVQFRKLLRNENQKDNRVIQRKVVNNKVI